MTDLEKLDEGLAQLVQEQPAVKPLLDRINQLSNADLEGLIFESIIAAVVGEISPAEADVMVSLATLVAQRRAMAADAVAGMTMQ